MKMDPAGDFRVELGNVDPCTSGNLQPNLPFRIFVLQNGIYLGDRFQCDSVIWSNLLRDYVASVYFRDDSAHCGRLWASDDSDGWYGSCVY